jgi:hypothetical protein
MFDNISGTEKWTVIRKKKQQKVKDKAQRKRKKERRFLNFHEMQTKESC